jgi:CHAT domain-containing protein
LLVAPALQQPLPGAEREVAVLSVVLDQHGYRVRVLQGADATRGRVLQEVPHSSVLDLATHSHFDRHRPQDSFVEPADGARLTAQDIRDQGADWLNHTGLVALSACTTGRQASTSGSEALGLTPAFLAAGARTLLVTAWQVADQQARQSMIGLYSHWLDGDGAPDPSVARALRQAWGQHACDPDASPPGPLPAAKVARLPLMPFLAVGGV